MSHNLLCFLPGVCNLTFTKNQIHAKSLGDSFLIVTKLLWPAEFIVTCSWVDSWSFLTTQVQNQMLGVDQQPGKSRHFALAENLLQEVWLPFAGYMLQDGNTPLARVRVLGGKREQPGCQQSRLPSLLEPYGFCTAPWRGASALLPLLQTPPLSVQSIALWPLKGLQICFNCKPLHAPVCPCTTTLACYWSVVCNGLKLPQSCGWTVGRCILAKRRKLFWDWNPSSCGHQIGVERGSYRQHIKQGLPRNQHLGKPDHF